MNKIKTKVSREANYIYHMLSVAKCGYDNEYGNKHLPGHSPEDLRVLKASESLITVKGGEHCGELYYHLVSRPASLDIAAAQYYELLRHLFTIGNPEETLARHWQAYKLFLPVDEPGVVDMVRDFYSTYKQFDTIVPICEVMIRNYPLYCSKVWPESEKELTLYAKDMERIFEHNEISEKLESVTRQKLKTQFTASFCNSLHGGAEAIDISEDQDIFGTGRSYEWAEAFISHEYIIYLLKQSLTGTTAFTDLSYWPYTEGLAEFYLSLAGGKSSGFAQCQNTIEFYKRIYHEDNTLTSAELFNMAVDNFISVSYA